jgi:hypothetical protein
MRYISLLAFCFITFFCKAQDHDSSSSSYADVNIGIGDNYFTARPIALNDAIKKTYYTAGVGYYHKSGLSIAVSSYYTKDKSSTTIYQTSITPAYDYEKAKHLGFGISYTHYFNKDSVSFYQSPLVNEYYAYVTYKNKIIEPTLSYTYADGKQKVKILNQVRTINANDYSLGLSFKHEFTWENMITKEDGFSFAPSFSLSAGSNEYGFNNTSGKGKGRLKQIAAAQQQSKKTFQLQDVGLSLPFEYKIRKFYLEPSISLDYYLPDSGSFSSAESLTIGFSF